MSGPMSERAPDITVAADGHADSTTVLVGRKAHNAVTVTVSGHRDNESDCDAQAEHHGPAVCVPGIEPVTEATNLAAAH
jgi:hypothetical protein